MDYVLEKMSGKSGCGMAFGTGVAFGTVRITDFDFGHDAVILAKTTEVLAEALKLSDEANYY